MKTPVPDYLENMVTSSRDAFCETLHNPALWSDNIIKKALERSGSLTFNINDVQTIVKDYLTVLSETIRRGEAI